MTKHTFRTTLVALAFGVLAQPVVAQSTTHLGQPLSKHVSLTLKGTSNSVCENGRSFFERFPNGEVARKTFRVPGGTMLVVTDFRWQAVSSPTLFPANGTLESALTSGAGAEPARLAYTAAGLNLNPDLANVDRVSGRDQVAAGVRVGSGRFLCAQAQSYTAVQTLDHTVVAAEVHGYLIPKVTVSRFE